jgi:hypothetical protein
MQLAEQWHAFKADPPGVRFRNQYRRMQSNGRAAFVGLIAIGAVLVLGGVALLFVPGPGLLLIVFGLALLTGVSKRLARVMDRIEPPVRRLAGRAKAAWKRAPVPVKLLLGFAAIAIGAALCVALYVLVRNW